MVITTHVPVGCVVGWSAVEEEDVGMVPLTLLTVPPHFS